MSNHLLDEETSSPKTQVPHDGTWGTLPSPRYFREKCCSDILCAATMSRKSKALASRPPVQTILLLLIFSGLLSGCAKEIDRPQVVGQYQAVHKSGIETLDLREDGTYIYSFKSAGSAELPFRDRWEFESFQGEPKVALHNFSPHFSQAPDKKADVLLLGVEKTLFGVRLYASYDLGEYYVKKRSS